MIQYDETRLAMEALTPQIEELKGALNLEGLKIKVDELEMKSTEPNFWDTLSPIYAPLPGGGDDDDDDDAVIG